MDRRVKYTKKIIKECFFDLLNEKEINKITVSELCTKADINRATFYRYYIDIYDLLEKIQEEFIEEYENFDEKFKKYENDENKINYLKNYSHQKKCVNIAKCIADIAKN